MGMRPLSMHHSPRQGTRSLANFAIIFFWEDPPLFAICHSPFFILHSSFFILQFTSAGGILFWGIYTRVLNPFPKIVKSFWSDKKEVCFLTYWWNHLINEYYFGKWNYILSIFMYMWNIRIIFFNLTDTMNIEIAGLVLTSVSGYAPNSQQLNISWVVSSMIFPGHYFITYWNN